MVRKLKPFLWLGKIKVLVWDIDGTLYHEIPAVKKDIHLNALKLISKAQQISLKKAAVLFAKIYASLGSTTRTLIHYKVDKDLALSGNWYSSVQLKHIKKDRRLVSCFKKLKNLRHIINTNGNQLSSRVKIKRLGLSLNTFEKIITNPDMLGKLKPELLPFKTVIAYTGLKPENHLFIGDREKTDIIPAKRTGMKTCIVWGRSKVADISLKKVYDIVDLFEK